MAINPQDTPKRLEKTSLILLGLGLGLVWGLFLGEYGSWVKWIGEAFVGLLQTTVLPYVAVSLICNVSRLSAGQGSRLARTASGVLLLLWGIGLVMLAVMSCSFPDWKAGSFFSTSLVQEPVTPKWLELFIPANPFFSLANNLVPAVVLFSIGFGIALAQVSTKEILLEKLDVLLEGLGVLNRLVVRLAPIGIFGIVGHTAGTLTIEQFALLQGYLLVYGLAALLVSLWILPALLACCTPFSEREILTNARDMLITAFILGNTFVVLPLIVDAVKRLMAQHQVAGSEQTPEYTVQLAYPFPDIGRILLLVFIPFAAWFYGQSLDPASYPHLIGVGFLGAFAKPVVTVPLLLRLAEIPSDIFNLFLAVGVVASRFGDLMKCMHLFAFSILTASVLNGTARVDVKRLLSRCLATACMLTLIVLSIRAVLFSSFIETYSRQDLISARELFGTPVGSTISPQPAAHAVPLTDGAEPMDRIQATKVLRVGIQPNNLPYSYYNLDGDLVGFDIDMAHQMARDLGVQIEFVHFSGEVADSLLAGHFDVAMSGLEGTIRHASLLPEMEPYMEVTRALVVPDHRRKQFRSLSHLKDELKNEPPLRVAVLTGQLSAETQNAESALGTGWGAVTSLGLDEHLEFVEIADEREFFESEPPVADALVSSAEAGSAWTLRNPDFTVVKPTGLDVQLPLYYFVAEESRLSAFVNSWLKLKRRDGTIQQLYDYWILGQDRQRPTPRWCILRDVLHWVD